MVKFPVVNATVWTYSYPNVPNRFSMGLHKPAGCCQAEAEAEGAVTVTIYIGV